MADVVPGSAPTDHAADETAIRHVLRRQQNGWDSGDPTLYADVFTAQADYVTFLGSHYQGRDAIAASYAPLFRKLLQGSRLTIEVKQVRFLTPDVALIHADAAVTKRGRRSRRPSRINTSVAVRTDDGWMLAASQNTTRRRLAETLLNKLTSRNKI
jgi:uncharacterized protein (TIGR02246 family)